ncbi:sensor histidine kinase [Fibrella sp. WM1]
MSMFSLLMTHERFRYRPTNQLKWQLILLFPWFIPLVTYLLLGPRYFQHWPTFVGATLINASIGVTCQLLLDYITQRIADRYPGLRQTGLRLFWLLLSFMTITPLFILGPMWAYDHGHWFGYVYTPGTATRILLFNVVVNLISVGSFESVYSLTKWRENMLEKEQLKKINLQSQYESLKNQVNPHFLFNTLNSLSSLIADEPERAEAFVDEMAKVYRYLLQTNRRSDESTDGELTTLKTELAFIQSYFHLLKTRYGQGIALVVDVPDSALPCLLPPLTLQMLVENAVKHNVIHPQKPLTIEIRAEANSRLLVRNNLQRKTTRVLSNQVGLSNITAKYRLLTQGRTNLNPAAATVIVDESNDYFTVSLPLLGNG